MRISLAVSTYQTNRRFLFGLKPDGRFSIFERLFDRAMGLYADANRIHLATRYQVWRLDNVLASGETNDGYDRLFVPRAGFTTGDLDIHDMALDRDGNLVFINTLYSCAAAVDERHNESDIFRAVRDKVIAWDKVHEISHLLLGQVAGRRDDRQITLFKPQGTGIMDVAIGFKAYERLKESGLAQSL